MWKSKGVMAVSGTIVPEQSENRAGAIGRLAPGCSFASRRLAREWRTLAAMVNCYCQAQHQDAAELCPECRGLLDYATIRLEKCRFGAEKPTCAHCPVHCYQRDRREQVKEVMRYAGPRMMWRHPMLSLRHWLDGFKSRRRNGLY